MQVKGADDVAQVESEREALADVQFQHADYAQALAASEAPAETPAPASQPYHRDIPKVGRNDPCPCGSGKKYKHCHGQLN